VGCVKVDIGFSVHFVLEHCPVFGEQDGGAPGDGRRIGCGSAERIVERNVTSPTLRNKATPDDKWSASHLAR
jgi:hypothetical protein